MGGLAGCCSAGVEGGGEARARAWDGFETWWGETSRGAAAVGAEGGGIFAAAEHCCQLFIGSVVVNIVSGSDDQLEK